MPLLASSKGRKKAEAHATYGHWINILEVDALANCGTARRYCDAFLFLNVFILALNVLILNMNALGNVNMMHINVRNPLLGGCRLNKEAGDAGSLRLKPRIHERLFRPQESVVRRLMRRFAYTRIVFITQLRPAVPGSSAASAWFLNQDRGFLNQSLVYRFITQKIAEILVFRGIHEVSIKNT